MVHINITAHEDLRSWVQGIQPNAKGRAEQRGSSRLVCMDTWKWTRSWNNEFQPPINSTCNVFLAWKWISGAMILDTFYAAHGANEVNVRFALHDKIINRLDSFETFKKSLRWRNGTWIFATRKLRVFSFLWMCSRQVCLKAKVECMARIALAKYNMMRVIHSALLCVPNMTAADTFSLLASLWSCAKQSTRTNGCSHSFSIKSS